MLAALRRRAGRALVVGPPYLWLLVFFLVPFAIVVKISMSDPVTAQPPYTPVLNWRGGFAEWREFLLGLDFENFETLWADDLYWQAGLASVRIALVSTALLLLVGYPMAYAMSRASAGARPILVALVILPFWTSFLIRVYAWIGILKPEGLLNRLLIGPGSSRSRCRSSTPRRRSISASSTPICPSWCCRSTPRSSGSTRR